MKKLYTLIATTLIGGSLFAGGILTNANQSAMYTRTMVRDATIGIDAVYFNPAGLALLPNNGFYLSINNQTLGQTKTMISDYSYLNNGDYEGKISAPLFPGVYLAYKMDKMTFSFGFNPIGGGGGGEFSTGLPSFEYPIADLVPALASQGAQGYQMDAYFEGTSAWFGYQGNITYQINDMISVALGARYVQAKDTYNGYLRNVQIDMGGTLIPANTIMTGISSDLAAAATGLGAAIGAGIIGESDPLADPTAVGTLTALGAYEAGMTNAEAISTFSGLATKYGATAIILGDQEAETEATATGVTPIISVNIKPNEQFNFSLKYEHNTALEFTYDTPKDFTKGFLPDGTAVTQFPDATTYRKDLPSQIVVGATYKPMDKLLISTGYHMYLDGSADWNGNEENVDKSSWEFGLAAEYDITESLLASVGYLRTQSGVSEAYQSDLSYSLPSNTFAGGFGYKINEKINLDLGFSYTMYVDGDRNFEHNFAQSGLMVPIKENLDKDVWIFGIGASFNFGAGK